MAPKKDEVVYKCIKCTKPVLENQNSICCDNCNGWIHLVCSRIGKKRFDKLNSNVNSKFTCKFCNDYVCKKCSKPVYPHQKAIQCDSDSCNSWYHLKCTHFTTTEYINKKSRLHTQEWICPECICIPFDGVPDSELHKMSHDDTNLKEYCRLITANTIY